MNRDKQYHFAAGYTIATLAVVVLVQFVPHDWCMGIAFSLATIAGIGKEIWDKLHPPHDVDPWDATMTIVGGFWGTAIAVVFAAFLMGPSL